MGSFSIWHWIIVLLVVLVVFGAGKLPRVATDVAQGIKNFKKGLQDQPKEPDPNRSTTEPPKPLHGGSMGSATDPSKDKVA